MPFGIASAPAIFQKLMDTVLKGIPHVICYIDDILVTGTDDTDHLQNIATVFTQLQDQGFRLRKEKCSFLQIILTQDQRRRTTTMTRRC